MRYRLSFRLFFYVLLEAVPYIILTLLILTTLIFAQQVARQAELLFGSAASFLLSLKVMACLLPGVIIITLPFALLIGSLMALSRLSADSEIIAARASGISLVALAAPLFICGLIGTVLSATLTLYVIPRVFSESKMLRSQIILQALTAPLKPQTFDNHFPNHLVYVREIDQLTGDWLGVFIVRQANQNESVVLTAERGRLRMTQTSPIALEVDLTEGLVVTSTSQSPEKQTAVRFQQEKIKLSADNPALANALATDRVPQEISLGQLASRGKSANSPQERRQAEIEWHRRLSLPLACLILVILTIPLGISGSRQAGKALAFTVGFSLAIIYYLILVAGQNLAISGTLPVWFGVWLPNIMGLLAILFSYSSSGTRLRLPAKNFLSSVKKEDKDAAKQNINKPSIRLIASLISFFRKLSINLINYLLLSEMFKFFILSLSVLLLTSLVFTLFELIPSVSKSGLGWRYVGTYLVYLAPQIIYYVTPFALLLALLTVHGVLSRSNQLTALLTGGQSALRLSLPLMAFCLITVAALFWLSEAILPGANREQDFRFNLIKGRKTEQSVLAFGQNWVRGTDSSIYGFQYNLVDKKLLNTFNYKLSSETGLLRETIFLQEASYAGEKKWQILKGWKYGIDNDLKVTFQTFPANNQTEFLAVPDGTAIFTRTVNEASKMSFYELKKHVRYLSDLGATTTSLRVDLEKKLSFPFSCLPLLAVAFPLALRSSRRSTLAGIGLSILIGFTYWITASVFESAGRQAYFPPGLAVWGPQALFLALGVFVTFRLRRK